MNWLWFAGGAVIGWVLMGFFTVQIGISLFCAFPMLRKLKDCKEYFYLNKCKGIFIRTVIINSILTIAAFAAIIIWAHSYMRTGFFVGFGGTLVLSIGQLGMNANNVEDMLRTLKKYAIPGKEDDAELIMSNITFNLYFNRSPK